MLSSITLDLMHHIMYGSGQVNRAPDLDNRVGKYGAQILNGGGRFILRPKQALRLGRYFWLSLPPASIDARLCFPVKFLVNHWQHWVIDVEISISFLLSRKAHRPVWQTQKLSALVRTRRTMVSSAQKIVTSPRLSLSSRLFIGSPMLAKLYY